MLLHIFKDITNLFVDKRVIGLATYTMSDTVSFGKTNQEQLTPLLQS
ncbi:MAG: hypothetical protein ACTMUB_08475 [cyanobacterium endosymbiont of Rhopalodia musculus]|nr:hypothetical protein [cyanobacterium endosymbiont of Epithemia clementina EcSB]WGT68110.1 hypothetical protein P3F56_03270 [cyanobacterium endosymbiont of Epithemia clementina EcSB]